MGRYRLFFSATGDFESSLGDSDDLIVNEGLTIYRRAPGRYRTPSPVDQLGPAALVVAGLVAITAGALLASHEDDKGAAAALIGGGAAVAIGGGVWGYDRSRATQQDGASTVWQVQPQQ